MLDDNDYTKKAGSGEASDVSNSSYDGNAMARFDTVWIKQTEEGSLQKVQICNIQLDEGFHAYAHTREDGTIMDYIWLSCFKGSLVGSKLRSLKGLTPCNSKTGTDEITYAGNNGSLWDTQTWSQINMVNMLLILMGKSTNTQAVFGYGHYNGGSSASNLLKTGTISNKGAFYGTSGNAAMKVFHIENYYGDIWNRIRGCVTNGSKQILVKMTPPLQHHRRRLHQHRHHSGRHLWRLHQRGQDDRERPDPPDRRRLRDHLLLRRSLVQCFVLCTRWRQLRRWSESRGFLPGFEQCRLVRALVHRRRAFL